MLIFLLVFLFLLILLALFLVIARKGRKLRTTRVLPGEASQAVLESREGKKYNVEPQTHFYFGKHPDCQIVLPQTSEEFVICIFHHRRRFAFETLSGSRGIQVNGEEQMAGYLNNGDVLEIAGQTFVFRCY